MIMDDILLGSLYTIKVYDHDGKRQGEYHVVAQERDEYEGVVYVESNELGMFATSPANLSEPSIMREV